MPRIQAGRTRRELSLRPEVQLSTDGLYDLVLAETGSPDLAERAAKDQMAAQLRAGQTPR